MMDCSQVQEWIHQWIDIAGTDLKKAKGLENQILAHASQCPACLQQWEIAQEYVNITPEMTSIPTPEDFSPKVRSKIEQHKKRKSNPRPPLSMLGWWLAFISRPQIAGTVVVVLVLVVGLQFWTQYKQPEPVPSAKKLQENTQEQSFEAESEELNSVTSEPDQPPEPRVLKKELKPSNSKKKAQPAPPQSPIEKSSPLVRKQKSNPSRAAADEMKSTGGRASESSRQFGSIGEDADGEFAPEMEMMDNEARNDRLIAKSDLTQAQKPENDSLLFKLEQFIQAPEDSLLVLIPKQKWEWLQQHVRDKQLTIDQKKVLDDSLSLIIRKKN